MIDRKSVRTIEYTNVNGFPPTVCIQLLDWCNLTCTNCRSDSSPYKKNALQLEPLCRLLDELKSFGNWRVSLTGGEPFFWPGLQELLVAINKVEFPFSITTNGFASIALFDTIPPELWENGTVYVSIDGVQKIHNDYRGRNSYEHAIEFLKHARSRVKKLFVNTVLFTDPSDWAMELYKELADIGVNNWTIISPVKKGRLLEKIDDYNNYSKQYEFIKNAVDKLGYQTTTSFLDFAKTDNVLNDIVFIDSDGSVRLPGYYTKIYNKPLSQSIHISDADVTDRIICSVADFIESENYML